MPITEPPRVGYYIGRLQDLQGRKLVYRRSRDGIITVQFDDLEAERAGISLAFGWHRFRRNEIFQL